MIKATIFFKVSLISIILFDTFVKKQNKKNLCFYVVKKYNLTQVRNKFHFIDKSVNKWFQKSKKRFVSTKILLFLPT